MDILGPITGQLINNVEYFVSLLTDECVYLESDIGDV